MSEKEQELHRLYEEIGRSIIEEQFANLEKDPNYKVPELILPKYGTVSFDDVLFGFYHTGAGRPSGLRAKWIAVYAGILTAQEGDTTNCHDALVESLKDFDLDHHIEIQFWLTMAIRSSITWSFELWCELVNIVSQMWNLQVSNN